jgi:predicted HTH domain antitoxin
MSQVTFDISEDALFALNMTAEAAARELRLAAAVKLYETGRLSAGAAAELAGVPTPVFLMRLADFGVAALDLSEAELEADVASA